MTPRKRQRLLRLALRTSDHNLGVLVGTELYRVMARTERLALAMAVYDERRDQLLAEGGQPAQYKARGHELAVQLDALLTVVYDHLGGYTGIGIRK